MAKVKVPANKTGFPFGAFIRTGGGFPARVVGKSEKIRTEVEVYGRHLEIGTAYTNGCTVPGFEVDGCTLITKEEFLAEAAKYGHDGTKPRDERLRKWDAEQGTWQ